MENKTKIDIDKLNMMLGFLKRKYAINEINKVFDFKTENDGFQELENLIKDLKDDFCKESHEGAFLNYLILIATLALKIGIDFATEIDIHDYGSISHALPSFVYKDELKEMGLL